MSPPNYKSIPKTYEYKGYYINTYNDCTAWKDGKIIFQADTEKELIEYINSIT